MGGVARFRWAGGLAVVTVAALLVSGCGSSEQAVKPGRTATTAAATTTRPATTAPPSTTGPVTTTAPPVQAGYVPMYPFADATEVAAWQQAYREAHQQTRRSTWTPARRPRVRALPRLHGDRPGHRQHRGCEGRARLGRLPDPPEHSHRHRGGRAPDPLRERHRGSVGGGRYRRHELQPRRPGLRGEGRVTRTGRRADHRRRREHPGDRPATALERDVGRHVLRAGRRHRLTVVGHGQARQGRPTRW